MKYLSTLLGLCVSFPLYFFLLYKILVHIEATELMWFLFCAYAPATFIAAALLQLGQTKS